jgi:hypothetical protein
MRVVPSSEFRVPSGRRIAYAVFCLLVVATPALPQMPPRTEPPKAMLVLDDQFERKQDIAQFEGQVLIMLYGDREGMPANKGLGEKLHVYYHPTAKGQLPADANKAPVTPLPGLPEGAVSPNVRVLPVACIGKVPDLFKNIIRSRVKKEAPDTLVLLDFEDKMKEQFGMKEGEPNLLVVDAKGRVRMKIAGELDEATYDKLLRGVDYLRKEAVGR